MANPFLFEIQLMRDQIASFDKFPFHLSAVKHLHQLACHPKVTFIIGENGAGKSTLLEAIAIAWGFNAEGGSRSFHFDTRASHTDLHQHLRLSRGITIPKDGYFLRAESFYNVATEIEHLDEEPGPALKIGPAYGKRGLHEQSHGESFLSLLTNRFRGQGFYILDEPEAALSPNRQMAVLSRIHQLANQNSQFIIATHSPIIMAYPNATIYHLSDTGIQQVAYTDTEHYVISKAFLNDPQKMLDQLLI